MNGRTSLAEGAAREAVDSEAARRRSGQEGDLTALKIPLVRDSPGVSSRERALA